MGSETVSRLSEQASAFSSGEDSTESHVKYTVRCLACNKQSTNVTLLQTCSSFCTLDKSSIGTQEGNVPCEHGFNTVDV